MNRPLLIACLLAFPAFLIAPSSSLQANDATPVASPVAQVEFGFVEPAGLLGDGWYKRPSVNSDPTISGLFAGPRGGRITLTVTNFGELGPASLIAWDNAQSWFENAVDDQRLRLTDSNSGISPNNRVRPRGCVDVVQGEGTDWTLSLVEFPIGFTSCLSTSGEIITVIVSGEYQGETGVDASNLVAELVGDFLGER